MVRITSRPRLDMNAEGMVLVRAEEHNGETTSEQSSILDSIKVLPEWQNGDRSASSYEPHGCSVCTEDFVENQQVGVLPCGHIYHQLCIDPWLLDFCWHVTIVVSHLLYRKLLGRVETWYLIIVNV